VDGEIIPLAFGMQVDRYKTHDIEVMIDDIDVSGKSAQRISGSVTTALRQGKGALIILDQSTGKAQYYSRLLMDPESGISFEEPEPNTFSFNSPYGYCPHCKGLGEISEIDFSKIMPDLTKSIRKGGLAPIGEYKPTWIFRQLEAIAHKYHFTRHSLVGSAGGGHPHDSLRFR
jgi:excinuclease ABC subunit A